jgi:hypothetical protein
MMGLGKTELARTYTHTHRHIEADQYFFGIEGRLFPNWANIRQAHAWCEDWALDALADGENVVVANTFAQNWEMEPYLVIAEALEAQVRVLEFPRTNPNDISLPHKASRKHLWGQWERWEKFDCETDPCRPVCVQVVDENHLARPVPSLPYLCQPGTCQYKRD